MSGGPPAPPAEPSPPPAAAPRVGRTLRRSTLLFGGIALIWLLGDWVYSRYALARLAGWESSVERDAAGVLVGQDALTVGEGPTALLLIHGINISPIVYRQLAPRLAEAGFACRAMRLPGFATPLRDYARSTRQEWIAGVEAEVRALRARHSRVWIVAHSLGGAIALQMLLQGRVEVDGLVLLAPAIEVSNARSPLLPTRFWHEFARRTLLFTQIVVSPFDYDLNDPQARRELPRSDFTPRAVVDQTFALVDANRGQAHRLRAPLLMILPGKDAIVDSAASEAYFAAWEGQPKKLLRHERSAHMLTLDYQWQDLPGEIADFIRVASPPPQAGDE